MEFLEGGELLDRIRRQHSFTEAQASAQFKQLISAVSFMHQRRVVHRDLKPEVGVNKGFFGLLLMSLPPFPHVHKEPSFYNR